MNNKRFASTVIFGMILFFGMYLDSYASKVVDSWWTGYLTGIITCIVIYLHHELTD